MFKSTDVFLTLGRRGSGKSYLARRISQAYPRRVIIDTLCEFSDSDGSVASNFEEFGTLVLNSENQNEFTIICQFDVEESDHDAQFEEMLRVVWYRGNCMLYIEEIQTFASTHSLGQWMRNCIFQGRHRNLSMIFTTQRPGECNKSLLSQSSHIFCGSLHEKNDIEYVRSILGEEAYKLSNLPERQFCYFQPGRQLTWINNDLKPIDKKVDNQNNSEDDIRETENFEESENETTV